MPSDLMSEPHSKAAQGLHWDTTAPSGQMYPVLFSSLLKVMSPLWDIYITASI